MIGRRPTDAQAFEQAWNGAAPRDEQIAELLRVVDELCEASAAVQPAPAFRDSLRTQLMAEAGTVLVQAPPRPRRAPEAPHRARPVRRRLAKAAVALIASAGAVGVVASSASAVPGEILYPVKRSVETVELQLHRSDASRGAFQLAQASERLAEARRLSTDRSDTDSADLIAETLEDFSSAAAQGSGHLFAAYADSGKATAIRQVNDFAAASSEDLSKLSSRLPTDATDAFTAAATTVTDLANEASTLCSSCAPADLGALAEKATKPSAPAAAPAERPATGEAPKPTTPPEATPAAPSAGKTTPPPVATTKPSTTPAPPVTTTKAPSLTDLTDPLLGGLLGNDDQVGLVPGLLGGLLGTPTPTP